jgi:hypothetical protein
VKNPAGDVLRLIQVRSNDAEFEKISPNCQTNSPQAPDRQFQFDKRSQHFIRAHNETFSVVAMRVGNPDCSPVEINR